MSDDEVIGKYILVVKAMVKGLRYIRIHVAMFHLQNIGTACVVCSIISVFLSLLFTGCFS